MIHCADAILNSIDEYSTLPPMEGGRTLKGLHSSLGTARQGTTALPQDLVNDVLESAETIIYCARHQQRIVDDILTLSRLDSDLLVNAPEAEEPVALIKNAIKMFSSEMKGRECQSNSEKMTPYASCK
jgi:signal transduction histidine kinase